MKLEELLAIQKDIEASAVAPIVCPSCATSYYVIPVIEDPREIRCDECGHVWVDRHRRLKDSTT